MWSSINNMQTYVEYTLVDSGGSLVVFVFLNALIIFIDISIMRSSSAILSKIKGENYMRLYLTLLATKFLIILIYPQPIVIYISVLIDPFLFGLMIPFNALFTKQEIPKSLSTIALMLVVVCSNLLVSILSPFYGYLYQSFGPRTVFGLMFCVTIVAMIISTKINFQKIDT